MSRLLLFILLLGLAGCSSVQIGRDFDAATFDRQAKLGATNQTQVKALLGNPMSQGFSIEAGKRLTEWVYYFGTGKLPGLANARFKLLQIRFDAQGNIKSYNWSE